MPARVQFVPNPSAEVNTTGWVTGGAGSTGTIALTRVADTAPAGSWVFNLSATALAIGTGNIAGAYVDVAAAPGDRHALQAQVRWVSGSAPTGAVARVRLSYRSGGGGLVSYDSPTVPVSQLTYALRTIAATAVAPALTTIARAEVQIVGGTAAGAAVVRFDAVMLELGDTASTYFDGATTDTATTRYDWTGTANASTSTATPWVDVSLVPSGTPSPVQIVLTGIPNGVEYTVTGTTGDGSVWPVPGGSGTSAGVQIVLVDNRGALNTPITYTATWGGLTYTSAPITVTYAGRYVLQSLDGQTIIPFTWRDNGDPRDYVTRSAAFDIPGRLRPAVRYARGGLGGGELEIRTARAATVLLVDALIDGGPLLLRTDGTIRDIPAVEIILLQDASNSSWGAFTAPGVASSDRVWSLRYLLVDDPEPGTALSAWTWDDFDDAMANGPRVWTGGATDFDGLFVGSTWDLFDTYPWGQLT